MPTNTLNIDFVKFKDFDLRTVDADDNVQYSKSETSNSYNQKNGDEFLVGYRVDSTNNADPEFKIPLSEVLNSLVDTSGNQDVDISNLTLGIDADDKKLYLYDGDNKLGDGIELSNDGGDDSFDPSLLTFGPYDSGEKKYVIKYNDNDTNAVLDLNVIEVCSCDFDEDIKNLKLDYNTSNNVLSLKNGDNVISAASIGDTGSGQTGGQNDGSNITGITGNVKSMKSADKLTGTIEDDIDEDGGIIGKKINLNLELGDPNPQVWYYYGNKGPARFQSQNSSNVIVFNPEVDFNDEGVTTLKYNFRHEANSSPSRNWTVSQELILPKIEAGEVKEAEDGEDAKITITNIPSGPAESDGGSVKINAVLPKAGKTVKIRPVLNNVTVETGDNIQNSGTFKLSEGSQDEYDLDLKLKTVKGESITASTSDAKDSDDNIIGTKVSFSDGTEFTVNNGAKGIDGISPIVTAQPNTDPNDNTKTGNEVTITYGTTNRKEKFVVWNGKDGVSPTVSSQSVQGSGANANKTGTEVTISYGNNNKKTFTVWDGVDGQSTGGNAGTLNTNNATSLPVNVSEQLSGTVNLHKISKTGDYSDLSNKPTIPENVSEFSNDAQYITASDVPYFTLYRAIFDGVDWGSEVTAPEAVYAAYDIDYDNVRFQKYNIQTLQWEGATHQQFFESVKHSSDVIECCPDSAKGMFSDTQLPNRVAMNMLVGIFAIVNGKDIINASTPYEEMDAKDFINLYGCAGPMSPIVKQGTIIMTIKVYTYKAIEDQSNN